MFPDFTCEGAHDPAVLLTDLIHGVTRPQGSPLLLQMARQPSIFPGQNTPPLDTYYTTFPLTEDGHLGCFRIFSF